VASPSTQSNSTEMGVGAPKQWVPPRDMVRRTSFSTKR
jgi:hypothetical protein